MKVALLARIRGVATSPAAKAPLPVATLGAPPEGWRFDSSHESEGWLKLPVPGVRVKLLSEDLARDVALAFIEMAPASRIPDHLHTMPEEGFLLSGDVTICGRVLRAGDYYRAEAGTMHTQITSEGGCTGVLCLGASEWRRWNALLSWAAGPGSV